MSNTDTRPGRPGSSRRKRSRPFSASAAPRRGGGRFSRAREGHNPRPRGGFENRRTGNRGGGRGRARASFDVSHYINRNPVVEAPEPVYEASHEFADFDFPRQLFSNIDAAGLLLPTPIQDQIIPHILAGRDVVGLANTGTGKTAAFLLPLIAHTARERKHQTLILTPTRELAIQIEAEFRKLGKDLHLHATVCVGGANINPQIASLRRQNHFIIGTPGRVMDLMERKALRTDGIGAVVLDEADRMLDMGFINDMRRILKGIPTPRKTLLFSATMPDSIEKLVGEFLTDPVTVSVRKQDVASSIEQDVVHVGSRAKFEVLTELLKKRDEYQRVILFGAMKHSVEKLGRMLNRAGIKAESIHGNKSHAQRQRALNRFKSGQVQVLAATDVAARGIHVDNVSHVINYDLPSTYEDYIHRIGRTGRGEKRGKALTFVE